MNFSYGDGHSYSISNYTCNTSAADTSLQCPTGNSFCIGIPSNSYTLLGNLTAAATLYNPRNQTLVSFNFFIYSEVHNVTDSLYVMPLGVSQSAPDTSNYWRPSHIPYFPLERPIWFVSRLQFGSETPVSYWWSFGDGSYNITAEPFVLHQFPTPETYVIILNTSNPLSSDQTEFISLNSVNQTSSIVVQRFL